MSEEMPATGIAGILAAPGSCARPSRAVPPGSVAELSCQKIIFDLQLADLPVQIIDLRLIAGSLRRTTTQEDACRTIQQLLLPVVDLVRVDPELPSQLGDGPVAPDRRQRHLRLERRAMLRPCPLHVLLPRYPRFLGAGLHLSHLSHFPGPAHFYTPGLEEAMDIQAEEAAALGLRITLTRGALDMTIEQGGNAVPGSVQDTDEIIADCERVIGRWHDRREGSMTQ